MTDNQVSNQTAQDDRGVIYVATGKPRYLSEVEASAASLRRHMPELPITVFSDRKSQRLTELRVCQELIEDPTASYLDKVVALQRSPYARTLFLDTDTWVSAPLDELFQLLDRFQVAAAHELARQHSHFAELPDAFPEFNSGVVALRMDEEIRALLRDWETRYRELEHEVAGDQDVFRLACYLSVVNLYVLTPEFNCQVRQAGCVNGPVRILHGRNIDMEHAERALNRYTGKRTFQPTVHGGIRVERYEEGTMKVWSTLYLLRTRFLDRLAAPLGRMLNRVEKSR